MHSRLSSRVPPLTADGVQTPCGGRGGVHTLTAGSGYDYLTRQVADLDATEKRHIGLASHYAERGETPQWWVGSGMVGIEELAAGGVVTAEQMHALFGSGQPATTSRPAGEVRQRALGDRPPDIAARIEWAHRDAVTDALPFSRPTPSTP